LSRSFTNAQSDLVNITFIYYRLIIKTMKLLSRQDGETLVKLARQTIKTYLSEETIVDVPNVAAFNEKRGVFCTLKTVAGELRGCIGLPYPTKALGEAVVDAAVASATRDPRFYTLTLKELDSIVIEVTVLTPPEKLEGPHDKFPAKVKVGKHGLIVQSRLGSGLLLPQVATENEWDSTKFLDMTCWKAGLPEGCWKQDNTEVFCFEGQIFKEASPNGKIVAE
jgi:hypothetical protein